MFALRISAIMSGQTLDVSQIANLINPRISGYIAPNFHHIKKRPVFRPRIGPPGITLQGIKFLFGWGQQPFATNVRIIPVKANFLLNFRVSVIPGFRQYDYHCTPIPIQDNGNFGRAYSIYGNVQTNQKRTL